MFFALDENNIRVNAEDGVFKHCVCPACGKPVRQRRGDTNRHHFAHIKKESTCPFEFDKDYINMSEWHIRMQEYFPKEMREHIFIDKKTGEKHIADVFIKEANTVLEFQYSSIKKKEFLDRTTFHLNEGRRIVWLFDESWKDADEESYNKKYYKNGKLIKIKYQRAKGPYQLKSYKWLYKKKFLEEGPQIYQPNYSVCIYTGAEGDIFHRILRINEDKVIVSLHDIVMSNALNVDEFFVLETCWQEQEPWKSEFDIMRGIKPFREYNSTENPELDKPYTEKPYIEIVRELNEAKRLHAEAIKKRKREEYWSGLLEHYNRLESKSKK